MLDNKVVSQEEWMAARSELLRKEKALTRQREAIAAERRALPWVKVEKNYVFHGPEGEETLGDLFGARSQLIVKHFMMGPGWKDGCVGCSFHADHMDGALMHLPQRDVTLLAVSRAPLTEIEAFRRRMGWRFKWVSSYGSDFNFDYHVSFTAEDIASGKVFYNYAMRDFMSEEMSGISVFYRQPDGAIFHTYSSYARGNEGFLGAYHYLDVVPNGRDEVNNLTDWVRHHDRYDSTGSVYKTGRAREAVQDCCHVPDRERPGRNHQPRDVRSFVIPGA
jgi:predicted dithiol-disulfide oxidoreductase (DUF899 family)